MEDSYAYYIHSLENKNRLERVKILKKHPNDDGYTIYIPSLHRERETLSDRLEFICTSNNYKCFMCDKMKNVEKEKSFFIKVLNKILNGCESCTLKKYNILPPQDYFIENENLYWEIKEDTYFDKTIYYKIIIDILSKITYVCDICCKNVSMFDKFDSKKNINICSRCQNI